MEERGAERVPGDDADGEDRAGAALRRDLDGDVADGEEESAGNAFCDREQAEPSPECERHDRRSRRRAEPEHYLDRRAAGALACSPRQGHRKCEQAEHRDEDAGGLVPVEAAAAHPGGDVGENADPARGHALDE